MILVSNTCIYFFNLRKRILFIIMGLSFSKYNKQKDKPLTPVVNRICTPINNIKKKSDILNAPDNKKYKQLLISPIPIKLE